MMTLTGEQAIISSETTCLHCGRSFYVVQGDMMPDCPCGQGEFVEPEPPAHRAHRTYQYSEVWQARNPRTRRRRA